MSAPKCLHLNLNSQKEQLPSRMLDVMPKSVIENEKDKDVVLGVSERFHVGFADTIGLRDAMEDKLTIYGRYRDQPDEDYFALFDGHGGHEASAFASENLHKYLKDLLDKGKDPESAFKEAFTQCNAAMSSYVATGTTAVAALAQGNNLWVANLGDSRAVLCNRSQAQRITEDHKPLLDGERKRITDLGGFVIFGRVNGQLAVSRALGDFDNKPYVSSDADVFGPYAVDDTNNQFLILACDGLWDVVSDKDAIETVKKAKSPGEAASALVQLAYDSKSSDNISTVVVFFPHYPSSSLKHEEENKS